MKLNKENIKQMAMIFTAIILIGIGFINSNLDYLQEENFEIAKRNGNEINLGDVELVNSEPVKDYQFENIVPNDELENNNLLVRESSITDNEYNNDIIISQIDYFEETRIERERMYSQMIETYEKIIQNPETPNDQKAISVQEISNITNIKNGIMIAENLIKNKGFEDVIILVNNDTASVVVKSYNLKQEQISKIQNIIQRELKIETKNINISNKF